MNIPLLILTTEVKCELSIVWENIGREVRLAGDAKEPTHFSKRVGHVVPGVVV